MCVTLPLAVYGRSDRHNDDWDAKACLEGDYSYGEQCPDDDLGASITPGCVQSFIPPPKKKNPSIHSGNILMYPAHNAFYATGSGKTPLFCSMASLSSMPSASLRYVNMGSFEPAHFILLYFDKLHDSCEPLFFVCHLPPLHSSSSSQIRSDIGAKAFKSVADSNNYGDDVTAAYLL